jgi:hypothetical protein
MSYWSKVSGEDGRKEDARARDKAQQAGATANRESVERMNLADKGYATGVRDAVDTYKVNRAPIHNNRVNDIEKYKGQAETQAKDARETYTNTIQPHLKGIMETAKTEADSAMTLKDAGDPNNSVQTAVRGMYEQQAQGVGKQGLADAGVLAALGAQATAGQMGGVPMTGGQMQALQGQNMAQSGMAYSRAQQQMQRLREQGIESGFRESSNQYDRGQKAKDRYSNSVNDFEMADNRHQDRQTGYRNEQNGYSGERYGMDMGKAQEDMGLSTGLAGMDRDLAHSRENREIGLANDYYGTKQANIAADSQAKGANHPASTVGTLVGAGVGAYASGGNPQATMKGAEVGGNVGNNVGNQRGGGQYYAGNYGQGTAQAAAGGRGGGGGYQPYGGGGYQPYGYQRGYA